MVGSIAEDGRGCASLEPKDNKILDERILQLDVGSVDMIGFIPMDKESRIASVHLVTDSTRETGE